MKKQDEFGQFREAIGKVKEINQDFLVGMYNKLSTSKQEHFKQVIYSQRIQTQEGKETARKIVKARARKTADSYSRATLNDTTDNQ